MTDPAPPAYADPQATPETAPTPPAYAAPVPAIRRPLPRAFWFTLLLATALTLAGTSFVIGAYEADAMPDTVVRQYFAALEDGDAAAALGYGAVPTGSHDLLTPAVLAAQNATGSIEGLAVRDVQSSGNTAVVDITYTVGLAGGPHTVRDSVPVVRRGHGWRLAQSAIPVNLNPDGGSALATLAGADVPTGDFLMFPGAVPVTYATPNLQLQSSSSVLRFVDGGTLDVEASVTDQGRRTILPALRTALVACLAGKSPAQPLCPVPDARSDVPGSLRGTVTDVNPNTIGMTVNTGDGKIDITGTVYVSATYQQLDQNNMATDQRTTATTIKAYCYATTPTTIGWSPS